jgi:hypothetical protein
MPRPRALREVELPDPEAGIDGILNFLRHHQDAVSDALAPLADAPVLDFVWKRDVVLAAGDNQIGHGLGRPWTGYLVTRRNAAIDVFDPDEQPIRNRLLTLNASGVGVVDLYMF